TITKYHPGSRNVDPWTEITGYKATCERKEHLEACRHKKFGPELYNSCRAECNGLERYISCRKPEFGVELYKECDFYKTPEEALDYAAQVKDYLSVLAENLIIHKGNYFTLAKDQSALGCHIKQHENEILYKDVIANLKSKFVGLFGVEYKAENYQ